MVVRQDAMKTAAEELVDCARRARAGFKVPRSVELLPGPLPLSGAFKPLPRELRRRSWEGRHRRVG